MCIIQAIITGGTGMIGRLLAHNLVRDGYEVITLSRNPAQHSMPAGVRVVAWDGRTEDGWGEYVEGATAVYNLAGASIAGSSMPPQRWTVARKREIEGSRWQAGQAVTAAVATAADKPAVVVQMSGIDYYAYGNELVTEESPRGDHYLSTVVADKWEASTAGIDELGLRRVIARTGPLLNLENGPLPASLLQFRLLAGGRLGSGRQWLSWIHAADAVNALQFLAETEAAVGPFNVVAPHPVTNQEYTETLGRVLGRPALFPAPAFALRAFMGEVAELVLQGRPASPAKLLALRFQFRFPDLEPALRDLLERPE